MGRSGTDGSAAPRRPQRDLCATRVYVSATPRATLRLFGARRRAPPDAAERRLTRPRPVASTPLASPCRACVQLRPATLHASVT